MKKRCIQAKGSGKTFMVAMGVLVAIMLSGCNLLGEILGDDDDSGPEAILGEFSPLDTVGRGYNALGNYADPREIRGRILDLDQLAADGRLDLRRNEIGDFRTQQGSNITEYTNSLSVSTTQGGSFKGFGGSVTVNFDRSSYQRAENSFATIQSFVPKQDHVIPLIQPDDLKPYITAEAQRAINDASLPPESLFALYGTHLLRAVTLGARLDYSYAINMAEMQTSQTVGVLAQASMEFKLIEAYRDSSVGSSELARTVNENSQTRLVIFGGRAEFGQSILNDSNYDRWINSIEGRETFIDFSGDDAIIGIWEFANDPTRRQAIIDHFESEADATIEDYDEQPLSVIVQLEKIRVPSGGANDDEGGNDELEIYGDIIVRGWKSVVNNRFEGRTANFRLWDTGPGNNEGRLNNMTPGREVDLSNSSSARRVIQIPDYDEDDSGIELILELVERDPGSSGDDTFTRANPVIYMKDGFRGTVHTVSTQTNRDERVEVDFTLTIQ